MYKKHKYFTKSIEESNELNEIFYRNEKNFNRNVEGYQQRYREISFKNNKRAH